MNALGLIVAFMAVLVVSTVAQDTRNGEPVVYGYKNGRCPAKYFYNDCNHCQCNPKGGSAGCSKIFCGGPQPGTVASKPLYAPNYQSGQKCPAAYFYDGCNTCECQKDGVTAGCSKKFCPPKSA